MEHFIPYYPNLKTTKGQQNIYQMEEFHLLEANEELEHVEPGKYYKDQLVVARLMNYLDRLFVIAEPGTGKTCKFIGWDETLKETAYITGVIFITASSLKTSLQHQILCKCTKDVYITPLIVNAKNETIRAGNITRSLHKWYDIMSYEDFAKQVKGKTSFQIREFYKGKVFNVDEAVNLIVKSDKQNLTFSYNIADIDAPNILNSTSIFIQTWRAFHSLDKTKIVIATATPIRDDAYEIFMLSNLLLPADRQINISSLNQLTTFQGQQFMNSNFTNLKTFEPYFNGLFSYIAAPNTGAYPNYKGVPLNKIWEYPRPTNQWVTDPTFEMEKIPSQSIVFQIEMFGQQAEALHKLLGTSKDDNFYTKENEISCYVDKKDNTGNKVTFNEDDRKQLKIAINRQDYASKFNFILTKEYQLYNRGSPGCAFVYCSLTNTGAVALKEMFISNEYSLLDPNEIQMIDNQICGSSGVTFSLPKGRRIAYVESGTGYNNIEKILGVFSSPQNVHGEYIQVLIGSRVVGTGVNISNVVRYYRVNPEWNPSQEKQTQDRVFRVNSHETLKKVTGKSEIPVDFYNLCSYARYFYPLNSEDIFSNHHINSTKIIYFVGFYNGSNFPPRLNITEIQGPIYNAIQNITYFETDDYYDEIVASFGQIKCVISKYNLLYLVDLKKYLQDPSLEDYRYLLITKDGDINKEKFTGTYLDSFFLFPEAKTSFDHGCLPCKMIIHSGNEDKYLQSERKSFPYHKFLRYAKQYATDCLVNYRRNYNLRNQDGSAECDYDFCRYQCVSKLENDDLLDRTLFSTSGKFMDNYEILYGSSIVQECKNRIILIISQHGSVTIKEILDELTPTYQNIFIYEAIYTLVSEKAFFYDQYGYKCYISYNDNIFFGKREYPLIIETNSNSGDYINKLIAVTSSINYNISSSNDEELIKTIENFQYPNEYEIKSLLFSFQIPESVQTLLERSLSRIIQSQTLPVDSLIEKFFQSEIYFLGGKYIHNHVSQKITEQAGVAAKYRKASNPFRVYDENSGTWRNATEQEQMFFSQQAGIVINQKIQSLLAQTNSKYYLSFINGVYRLVDNQKDKPGISVNLLKPDQISEISTYFNIPLAKDNIINLFKSYNLVYYYTYPF